MFSFDFEDTAFGTNQDLRGRIGKNEKGMNSASKKTQGKNERGLPNVRRVRVIEQERADETHWDKQKRIAMVTRNETMRFDIGD